MTESLKSFANSLREYLLNTLADSHNTPQQLAQRFNNLKVWMDPRKQVLPHFCVSVGISQACFDINRLEKLTGNIGPDERFILRWASKSNINGELKRVWMILTKAASGNSLSSSVEEELEEKLKIANAENQKADMLGIGVTSRFKAFERYNRRREWQKL